MSASKAGAGSFLDDPALFVERVIKDFVRDSQPSVLEEGRGGPFFDEPLVGFADGDDPLFQEYKKVIGPLHLAPREALDLYLESKGAAGNSARISVISFIMPIAKGTRLKQREETRVGCLEWNRTRWKGQEFVLALSRHVVSELESVGCRAVAPEAESFHKVDLKAYTSNWSHRHMAYAAGLGTFGLTDGFLSPVGMAMRCGSIVTDAVIKPTPRKWSDPHGACLFYQNEECGRCISRCPAGAITAKGHDKQKCSDYLGYGREIVKQLGREGYIGHYAGCGLCQTKVPCEAGIPSDASLADSPPQF